MATGDEDPVKAKPIALGGSWGEGGMSGPLAPLSILLPFASGHGLHSIHPRCVVASYLQLGVQWVRLTRGREVVDSQVNI